VAGFMDVSSALCTEVQRLAVGGVSTHGWPQPALDTTRGAADAGPSVRRRVVPVPSAAWSRL
jgi:hypothetical protein